MSLICFALVLTTCGGPLVPSQNATDLFFGITSNFSPRLIPDCVLWLDGDDPLDNGGKVSNNTSLSQWDDKSGLGNHALQATIGYKPTYMDNLKNGRGGVYFNAFHGMSSSAAPSGWTWGTTAPKSVYIVFEFTGNFAGNNFILFGVGGGGSGDNLFIGHFNVALSHLGIDSGGSAQYVTFGSASFTINILTPYILSYRNPTSDLLLAQSSLNGIPKIIYNYGGYPNGFTKTLSSGPYAVGSAGIASNQFKSYEIILYDRKLTDAEDLQVLQYLKAKWGMY